MVSVEQWADVRRMARVEGLSARGISRRTGLARATVARLLAAPEPPRYARKAVGSKLDPFKDWICEQLAADPRIQSQRLREMAGEIGKDDQRLQSSIRAAIMQYLLMSRIERVTMPWT